MAIEKGASLPEGTLVRVTDDGPEEIAAKEFFADRRVILFGVPGAFTPTCHNTHMPPFVARAEEFREKGVDEIAVISVNDPFVMGEWRRQSNAMGRVTFLSDGAASYTKALGMEIDLSSRSFGVRSRRYAMLVEDGEVKHLATDDQPGTVTGSSADEMMAVLDGSRSDG